jgi:general secretion pathway protein C
MDLAKVFARWRSQPPEQWLAQVNRVLPPVAVSVLVILLAFQAAGLTWRLLDRPAVQDPVPPAVVFAQESSRSGGNSNLETLRGWEPFGSAPDPSAAAVPAGDILEAELTQLDLRLHGVLQHQALPEPGSMVIPEAGIATISISGGTPKTFHTGESIGTTPNRTLHSVYWDQVLLDPGGGQKLEKLAFPSAEQLAQRAGRPTLGANRNATTPFRAPQNFNDPATASAAATGAAAIFGQHIQLRMHTEGDEMIGFRVEPRNDSPVLSQLGLEPGDVLTEVNGKKLGDLRNVNEVLQTLQESPQANVVVRRNGVNQPMSIDIGQIARFAESLQ